MEPEKEDEYDYRNMAQRDDLDGILVATGVQKFGRIAVDVMKAGKNVGTEVTGPHTLEDCWGIVEEKERFGKHYMLLENCCYDSRTGLYIHGDSPLHKWESVEKFQEKYRHPFWRKDSAAARKAGGRGGMDYFCIRDFVDMVRHDREPWIDCYDSAAWNVLNHCSALSIDRKGAPVEIPDFTKGKWEDPDWRGRRPGPAAVIPG